jgi:hypothetical protein
LIPQKIVEKKEEVQPQEPNFSEIKSSIAVMTPKRSERMSMMLQKRPSAFNFGI